MGTANADNLHSMQQTADGGFVLGGMTDAGINGDKTQASKGGVDFWVVKLAAAASAVPNDVAVTAITSANSGCSLTNQETITITVNNLGTTAQSNIPVSYKINATGTPVNEIFAGPVAPNSSSTYSFTAKADLSAVGTYNLEAKTNLTGDAFPANDALTKAVTNYAVPALPVVASSGSTTLCSGGSLTLTATCATSGVTYQWFNNGNAIANATGSTYTANAAGSYTAKAIIGGTCSSTASNAIALTVTTTPPAPGVNHSSALAICSGDSVTLTAVSSVSGATFNWFKDGNIIMGANAATYMAKTAGSYTAMAIVNGCNSPASIARAVTVKALPAKPSIARAGSVLSSNSLSGNQWYNNGVAIPGATGQTYTATSNGTYTVVVTGTNGCHSAPSSPVSITNTGMHDDETNLAVTVYPNPSTGVFNISLAKGEQFELVVTDLSGKVITKQKASKGATQLNLQKAAKGIYLLQVSGEKGSAMRKLIVE